MNKMLLLFWNDVSSSIWKDERFPLLENVGEAGITTNALHHGEKFAFETLYSEKLNPIEW